jgi:hypothetical protein
VKLSITQKAVLSRALNQNERLCYSYYHDTTMRALAKHGFVEWHDRLGHKYSKSHWYVTDAGIDWAKAEKSKINLK